MAAEPLGSGGPIRILRVFSRLNVGGPSIHVILLTAGLRPRGYDTTLIVGYESAREGNLDDLASARGVEVQRLAGLGREIRPFQDLRALVSLWRLLRRIRPQIVHTHTAKAGMLGRVAAVLAGVPVVVHTYHGHVLSGYFSRFQTGVYRAIESVLARFSDRLIAVSGSVRDDLVRLGVAPAAKLRVVALGLELGHLAGELPRGRLRAEAGFDEQAPLVGIVGRLVPIKDVPTFLAAARLVVARLPAARFVVVGDGEERARLEEMAGELVLGGVVRFLGWRRDLASVLGGLDLVVNCSLNEGTPVALIEALAAARPVIATRVGGTPDLLEDGRFGLLVPPRDAAALAGAMVSVLSEPGPALARSREGQRAVLEKYSVERLLGDVDALYRELLLAKGLRTPGLPRDSLVRLGG
jgi:glycosyltransferase involved in cell wall biosynthesis